MTLTVSLVHRRRQSRAIRRLPRPIERSPSSPSFSDRPPAKQIERVIARTSQWALEAIISKILREKRELNHSERIQSRRKGDPMIVSTAVSAKLGGICARAERNNTNGD